MLTTIKINGIDSKIPEALTNDEIIHENVITNTNWELKDSIRMMNNQRNDTEKVNLIEKEKNRYWWNY